VALKLVIGAFSELVIAALKLVIEIMKDKIYK
jgi:hypothetical protein